MTERNGSQEEGGNMTVKRVQKGPASGNPCIARPCLENTEVLPRKRFPQGPQGEQFEGCNTGGQPQTQTKCFG